MASGRARVCKEVVLFIGAPHRARPCNEQDDIGFRFDPEICERNGSLVGVASMTKRHLASTLLACAVLLTTGPAVAQASLQPPLDTAAERQALQKLTFCVAEKRPRWARQLISYPYLSDAQADAAAELVSGNDNCQMAREVAVAFRTSGVAGDVAEHFLRGNLVNPDMTRVSAALATASPLNVSEDFALCVASRNPAAAFDLVRTEPGSEAEARAGFVLATAVPSCTNPNERLDINLESLRSLVATALYRAVSTLASN